MIIRVLSNRTARLGALTLGLTLASVADAQVSDSNVLRPFGSRAEGGVVLPSARLLQPGAWELALIGAHEGGVVRANVPTGSVRGGALTASTSWIDQRDVAALQLTFSPLERFEFFGALPALLGQTVHEVPGVQTPTQASALGDASVGLRFALLPTTAASVRGLSWVVQSGVGLGTGSPTAAFGDGAARFDASTSVTWESGQSWAATGHLGYRMGSALTVADQVFGDQVVVGASGAYRRGPFQFNVDVISTNATAPIPSGDGARAALELLGGVRYLRELFFVDLGAGFAPLDAGPTPQWRVQAALGARGSFLSARARDPDPDQDGVLAADDRCPTVAEDLDGFEDEDGCPDLDNDADGIVDARDACPGVAEDLDGVADHDGCPETDEDADGVADASDTCPIAAEDFDGFEDEDGCPESGSADGTARFRRLTLTHQAVYFETGKSVLDAQALAALRPIARSLLSEAGIVLLTGHADDQGTPERNVQLSTERAEAVKEALIGAGVPADRIRTRGAGQHETVTTPTAFGRSLNRSVTFEWAGAPAVR